MGLLLDRRNDGATKQRLGKIMSPAEAVLIAMQSVDNGLVTERHPHLAVDEVLIE